MIQVISRNTLALFLLLSLLQPALSISQDIEQELTENSEKFLSYSQNFVKLASQNINVDADYYAALKLSLIADEFHQHSSYIADFILIIKIVKRQQPEKEMIEQIVKSRISNVINLCKSDEKRIVRILSETEHPDITASAIDLKKDLGNLQQILTGI